MKKLTTLSIAALFCAATAVHAEDLYFDANGTDPGFGIDATNTFTVDFTLSTWTMDTTGLTGHTTVSTNDFLHFGLEGTGGNLFNWINYGDIPVSGLHSYQTADSTASINRFQKKGGGFETLKWASNAVFQIEQGTPLHWDFGTFGDFEKTGNQWLRLGDGGVKVNGTCTLSEGFIVINQIGTVDEFSSFELIDNGLRFKDTIDDGGPTTATIGKLTGSSSITRDGSESAIGNLTVQTEGVDLSGDGATNSISFGWGSTVTLSGSSSNTFDIAKSDSVLDTDYVKVDWNKPITFGGDLAVNLLAGSDALVVGDSFQLFQKNAAASFLGSFDSIDLPELSDPGIIWSTTDLAVDGTINVIVADTNAPSAPTGLTAVSNAYTVSLDWDDNPEATLTGYKVYRSETSGSGFVEIADVSVSEYTDTTASPDDTTYYYEVRAYNFVNTEGDASDEASTTVLFNLRNGDFELPALPSGGITIDASGDWTQVGSQQGIQKADWAAEDIGGQGAWLKGWNKSVTNSFYQDKAASAGLEYTLDAGFQIQDNFRANGGQVEMSLVWLNGGSSEISRDTLDVDTAISTNGWAHTHLTATAPSGCAFVRATFYWTTTTNAGSGSGDQSAMVDNATISRVGTPAGYDVWASTSGVTGGPNDDQEPDGMDNLLEYALGGNPTIDDAAAKLPAISAGDDGWFYYVHNERTDDDTLTYTVQLRTDLADGGWGTAGLSDVEESGAVNNIKSVTNRTDIGDTEFIRLEIEQD